MRTAMLGLSAVVLAFLAAIEDARAAEIVVGAGQSVQAAVESAPEGSEITLAPGTFDESITITKSLTLRGAGWAKTTVGPSRATSLTQKQKDEFFAALEAAGDPRERAKIAVALATRPTPPTLVVKSAKGVILRGIRFRGPSIGAAGSGLTNESLVSFDNSAGSIVDCAVVGPSMNGITIQGESDVKIER